jgi:hypothetical protein
MRGPGRVAEDVTTLKERLGTLEATYHALDRLTDAKFITHRTLLERHADTVALALAASDKAVTKAEIATEKRFESVNEFRQTLSDQTKTFLARTEFMAELKAIEERQSSLAEAVKAIQIWQGNITGRLAVMASVFAVLMTVVVFAANYATRS